MKNKPNLQKHRNNHKHSHSKGIRKSPTLQPPKQTQFTECQNNLNLNHREDLRNQIHLYEKRSTNYAKQSQFTGCPNERNLRHNKDLRKSATLQPRPKQTQSNPIPNLFPASLPPSIALYILSTVCVHNMYRLLKLFAWPHLLYRYKYLLYIALWLDSVCWHAYCTCIYFN